MVGPSLDAFHVHFFAGANSTEKTSEDETPSSATMASKSFHVAALTLGPPRTAVRHAFVNAMMFCIKSFIASFGMFKQAF